MQTGKQAHAHRIPAGIWMLGIVSLLMDVSSEIVHSLLPLFLAGSFGVGALYIGMVEGLAESTALVVKVFSGAISDWLGRRKILAVAGYALAALSKPLFALAGSAGAVMTARLLDRLGKGIRGAPRDALIADITPPALRGAAFGLRQSLDTVGAVLGPLLASALMLLWLGNVRAVFWVAVIPALASVLVLVIGVREPAQSRPAKLQSPLRRENLARLGRRYWLVVIFGAAFTLARFSEAFLLLRAQQCGLAVASVPLVMVLMNLVYALTAYPFGKLSDRMNGRLLLAAGLGALLLADLLLGAGTSRWLLFGGVALWGLHLGLTQGLLSRMVADAAPGDLRGTAFGCFNLASGAALLVASLLAGALWQWLGAAWTFHAGAVLVLLSLLLLARAR